MAALSPFAVAQGVLNAVAAYVDNTGDNALGRVCVVPGEIAWDDCQCGQLVISEDDRWPSSLFPLDQVDHSAECGEPWHVVQFILSLTRCVPGPDNNGNPPACSDLSAAAQQLMRDKARARRAAFCYLSARFDANEVEAFELGHSVTVGPEGLCAGHELTIFVGWTNDCGC